MSDKKERDEEQRDKEENFTGSPEQQLPDLEADYKHDADKEQLKDKVNSEKK